MTVFDELSSNRRPDPGSGERPAGFSSLVDLLRWRSSERPAKRLFTFLDDGERESAYLTYGDLDRRARTIAARLQKAAPPGSRALLIHPPGQSFVEAFFGCLYAGVVAVPSYPPRSGERLLRLASLLEDARPAVVLTDSSLLPRMERAARRLPAAAAVPWIATDALDADLAGSWQAPRAGLDDLAFLQYTSGSTSEPKGVMVTHGNLLHNEAMIQEAFGQTPDSVVVGWLPLYHDMGLIGNVLQPLFAGASCVLMLPLAFLQRPVRWLEAISRYRGTTSGGPNFAYELCARKVGPADREGLDLSCWQVAFSGAEPVRVETLALFAREFASCGFRRDAFYPCYGLAEATLFVAGGSPGAGPAFTGVDAAGLEENRALPADGGAGPARLLTGCGRAWSSQRIAVVDPTTAEERSPDGVGEIWVAGPSVAAGYWNRPELSAETFCARLASGDGPFLRTGDLGFLQDGQLFVTGRIKDLIILRGRNHYPQDVELTVERSHPALRPGSGAAFAVEIDGAERLVVVQEIERNRRAEAPRAAEAARRAVAEEHEIRVHEVVLVLPGAVPKTTSGKVQRRACRAAYLEGSLEAVHRGLAPGDGEAPFEPAAALERAVLLAAGPDERQALLVEQLGAEVARVGRLGARSVSPGERLSDLGFDSLLAAELKHRLEDLLEVEVPVEVLLESPTLAELASWLGAALERPPHRLPRPAASGGDHPLSAGQKALWLTHELAPESGAYNLAGVAAAPPGLDPAALRRAWQSLVDRHPALRTGFARTETEPRQRVRARDEVDFEDVDATGWAPSELEEAVEREAFRPFDLERDRLLRVRAFRAADGSWRMLLVVHHLVADFWSVAVLLRELTALYAGAALPLPGLPYADWVRWQEEALAGDRLERLWEYWKERLDGAPLVLELPADRPRPPVQGHAGGAVTLRLGEPLAGRLREVSRKVGATLYMTLLAAFQTLLHRQTGQEDLVVGSPVSGRTSPEWRDTVGYFVNPLVLRARFAEAPAFLELLVRVRRTVLTAFANQDLPFLVLAERLQPQRDPGRPALFQVLFVLQKAQGVGQEDLAAFSLGAGWSSLDLGGLPLKPVLLRQRRAQLDLSLAMAELAGGGLAAAFEYAAELFDEATVRRLAAQLETLLEAVAEEPGRSVAELPVLSAAARHQLLHEWNAGDGGPRPECLHHLFEAQAERTPDAVAVEDGPARLTYAELDRRASRLAGRLRRLGVGPEERVGVHLGRSPELLVALLGVLKAGGAYVSLDLDLPPARLDFMMADAGTRVVLTRGTLLAGRPGIHRVLLDGEPPEPGDPPAASGGPAPENLAYLIYTSGSTGRPKGVAIEHRSAAVLLRWAREEFSPAEIAAVLASTSISFDLSVFEIFVPLAWGGRVVLAENALRVPMDSGVTLFNTVPSVMAELLRSGGLPASVRSVNLAGEPLPQTLVDELHACPGVERVRNLYGPSEDTTYSTSGAAERSGERVPSIGRPIAATRALVLDSRQEPVPPGALGELFLGGRGLARGYWSRPGLTAERFVPDPFASEPGARLYRTGDLVRHRADGRLDFLGRIDHQVKLRGVRIELGEIEAALAEHPAVREAVAVVREDAPGDRRLVAYVVPAEGESPSVPALRSWLSARLPAAMVPSSFLTLEELPLTPNGKLDRRALPHPPEAAAGLATAPRTPVEEVLAGLWSEVLDVERPGIDDDFFDLGGHSLLAVRLVSRVRASLGVEVPLRELFERPTVAQLGAWIEEARRQSLGPGIPPLERLPRDGAVPASFAQRRLWFLDQLEPGNPAYNIPLTVRLSGELRPEHLGWSLSEVARRHEVLRTTFAAETGEPMQVIAPATPVPLPAVDLSALGPEEREAVAARLARDEACRRFDLARGPLVRASLLRLDEREHVLLLALHHTVGDGWSLGVLLGEVAALYGARLRGEAPALPDPPVQYADYALWQRRWLDGEVLERQIAYWRQRLGDAPPVLDLPIDRPRPAAQTYRGARIGFAAPPDLAAALPEASRREQATPFMFLLAALQALLVRYTGQTDVCVGAPVAGRSGVETEGLIGLFVNVLVLRTDAAGDPRFSELLRRVRETSLSAYLHQDLPFERVVEELRTERSLAQSALFQVLLVLQNAPLPALELPGLALRVLDFDPEAVKFDLSLEATLTPEGLAGRLAYSSDLFEAATAGRLVRHFLNLLKDALAHPGRPIGDLALLEEAERAQLLRDWSEPRPAEDVAAVHELFALQAERDPRAPALVAGDERLSRGELLARARGLALRLRRLGVVPETTVALLAERTASTLAGMLAVLEAGGAYVPIDPDLPDERLAFLLEDVRAAAILAHARLAGRLRSSGLPVLYLDDVQEPVSGDPGEPPIRPAGENLAYVIYTSGSTGRPKGIAVEHRQLAAYTRGVMERLDLEDCSSFAVVSTLAADLGHTALFPALVTGGCLHVVSRQCAEDAEAFADYMERHGVDVLKIVPSHLSALLPAERPERGLPRKRLILGGEAASWEDVDRFQARAPQCRIFNHYGPTETTVGVLTFAAVPSTRRASAGPPLGRPLPGSEVYLLDGELRPVPPGAPGELHVGGAGVSRGYFGRPDLTAERFVPHPFSEIPGGRLYRTGDLARRRSDGNVEFLGRADRQVKVRGFRVELGEVAAALKRHPAVKEAVAVADRQRLVAYLVGAGPERPAASEVAAFLRESLPDYMVPSAFAWLDAIPLTPNGKLDERALPVPSQVEPEAWRKPRTPTEEILVGFWTELLGVPRAGIDDDFFALGGHSLLATQLVSRVRRTFRVDLPLRALFEVPTPSALAARIKELRSLAGDAPPIPLLPQRDGAMLSFAQERLWFIDQLDPGRPTYNLPYFARIEGPLEAGVLRRSLEEVVRRHEALRTRFPLEDGRPVQGISPAGELPLPLADLSALPCERRASEADRLARDEAARPFDLAAGPLLRCLLLRHEAGEHTFLLNLHHIVSDAWSRGILAGEVARLYEAFRLGKPAGLPELSIQYADFAVWQRDWVQREVLHRDLLYWLERLGPETPALQLPTDRPRPASSSGRGGFESFSLPAPLVTGLRGLARREGASLFMVLLSAFSTLLRRYSGQRDLVVGSPIANRNHPDVEPLIGFFANTLALRIRLEGDPPFSELLARVRDEALGAYEHQDLPFERVVKAAASREAARGALFEVMFLLQNAPMPRLDFGSLTWAPFEIHTGTAKFDLTLSLVESEAGLTGFLEYARDLFEEGTALRLLEHLRNLLDSVAANAELPITELALLGEAERSQVLKSWNETGVELPPEVTVAGLIFEQARRRPGAVAVATGRETLTYAELERRSEALARRLRQMGAGPEVRIGIALDRTPDMMVALLGVMRSGAGYVPLDLSHPRERSALILRMARPLAVITRTGLRGELPGDEAALVLIDDHGAIESREAETVRLDGDNVAYVLFTSGSTGRPKGVQIPHRALLNLLLAMQREPGCGESDALLAVTTLSFDMAGLELLLPLVSGGRVELATREEAVDGGLLRERLARSGATMMQATPAMWRMLLDAGWEGDPRLRVLSGGEALSGSLAGLLLERAGSLWNLYGPTETTVYSALQRVGQEDAAVASVTLGGAIANTALYVLDPQGQPAPVGVPGELAIAGLGLARGYLDAPHLTAERFVPDPFSGAAGARMYRTGDLARRRPNGTVDFLGRIDFQVKVRGFRVELGEIEAALLSCPGVRQAVAGVRGEGMDRRLVAWLVAEDPAPEAGTLREHLRTILPDYMVPAAFAVLPALPLSPTGKVDRNALPEPGAQGAPGQGPVMPRNPVEGVIAEIWRDLLGVERVGAGDSFFELGGDSLLATQLALRLRRTFGVELPVRRLFEEATLARLAAAVQVARQGGETVVVPPIPRAPREGVLPLSFAQERLWFIDQLDPGRPTYNLPYFARIEGPLEAGVLRRSLEEVVRRHEALRTRFPLEDGRPVQGISPAGELPLPLADLSALPCERRASEADRLARDEAARPFDLAAGPLLRCLLLRHEAGEHTFLLNLHHIVSDAWSRGILAGEVARLYEAFRLGKPAGLPELSIQYADFAVWQRDWVQREVLHRDLLYWLERLGPETPALQLPTDRPRPASSSGRGGFESFSLPAPLVTGLRGLARREGASLFMVLLSAFSTLLRRYSGQRDLVVGSPIANRNHPDVEPLIGFFANTLALRIRLEGDPPFSELLARVRDETLGAYEHQDLPFERLVEAVAGAREANRGPLFEVVFLLQNAPMPRLDFGALAWTALEVRNSTAKFDLTLSLTEVGETLSGVLVYDADLYDAATAGRLLRHYETLLEAAVADPGGSVARLPLLPAAERRQVLAESRPAGRAGEAASWVQERFDHQAERTPEAVALVHAGRPMTYLELRRRADRLAGWLAAQGIGPGATVGICLRHGPAMVVAVLGVLKSGAAYVPMDPGHPSSRLAFMAADAGLSLWLSDRELSPLLPRGEVPCLDLESQWEQVDGAGRERPPVAVSGEDAAYVIYTSGSTGRPKGVCIPHASLLNYVLWAAEEYLGEPGLGTALYSSLSFDLTVTSIYPPLLTGGTLHIFRDPGRGAVLEEIFRSGEVDVVKLTPSHLALIRDLDNRGSRVRRLIVGGEALERDLAQRVWDSFGGRVEVFNEYGPTEATVGCMIHLFDPARDRRATVPIGRPAADTGIYVLDEHFEPVPSNVVGELCIAGRGLARGYHGRPDLTAAAFIPSPFGHGERLYRSGDLARRLPDGRLEFLGRRDAQVKFHGFRVELDEIRGALNRHGDIRDSVVQVRKDPHGNDVLVAYYVSRRELDVSDLRAFLAGSLQEEMIPNLFVHLRKLPLTLNGKVNFQALPGVEEIRSKLVATGDRTMRRPTEEILGSIWSEVLGVTRIGLRDNFFELGGHSLLGTQVVSRVRDAFGVDLPLRSLFEQPTVEELAQRIENEIGADRKSAAPPLATVPRNGGLPLSFAQQRLLFLERLQPGSPLYNVPGALRVEGALDLGALRRLLDELVRRHETLRTRFADLGGETVQIIDEPGEADLAALDLSALPPDRRGEEITRLATEEAQRPFLLARAAPLRVRVLRCGEIEHVVLLTLHHIVSDGWSMGVLIRELGALYEASVSGRMSPLPELPIQYADFACWQRRWLDDEAIGGQLQYWLRQLEGAPPLFELPTDRPRPAVQSYRGAVLPWDVPAGLRPRLEALARREGATLFMVLLAGFQTLLRWFSGQEDFVVGTDVANRNRLETEGLIGFFVNQLPLRARLARLSTFREVLAQAREATLSAYVNQDAPFERVVEGLRLERTLAYSPLLQVKINLHNFRLPSLTLPGLSLSPVELPTGTAKLDLQFDIFDGAEDLVGSCQYRTDLFDADTVRRLLRLFGALLEKVAEEPGIELAELTQILDSAERVEDSLARDRFRASRSAALRARIKKPGEPRPLQGG